MYRPNKNANGFSNTDDRRKKITGKVRISNPKHPDYNEDHARTMNKLNVFGTCDVLAVGINYKRKKVIKQHPVDMGYFKEVYVLSDFGKMLLKNKRYQYMMDKKSI